MPLFRAILDLSRPAHWPAIWSNCLAGWWLGGGRHTEALPFLFVGASLLYLGAAFLNDAFDSDFDRQHRPTKPIPAGTISEKTVWNWGVGFLILGSLVLLWCSTLTGVLALTIAALVIIFNTLHRLTPAAPVLPAICRLLLYTLAAATAARGLTGPALWCGVALAVYVCGAGYLGLQAANPRPGTGKEMRYWPVLLLAVPILLALLYNQDNYREPALLLSAVLALWCLLALRQVLWSPEKKPAEAVEGLAAGIVLVDLLAVGPVAPRELSFGFLGLFLLTLALQRLPTKLGSRPQTAAG